MVSLTIDGRRMSLAWLATESRRSIALELGRFGCASYGEIPQNGEPASPPWFSLQMATVNEASLYGGQM